MDIEVNGQWYGVGRLKAFQQLDVAMIFFPVFGEIAPLIKENMENKEALREILLPKIFNAFSSIDSDTRRKGIKILLSTVHRKGSEGTGYSPIPESEIAESSEDLGLVMQLAWASLKENFTRFFPTSLSISNGPIPKPSGP